MNRRCGYREEGDGVETARKENGVETAKKKAVVWTLHATKMRKRCGNRDD